MCGITGKISINFEVNALELKRASDAIQHRGPDDEGFFISERKNIGFAHRRLSLIDLSKFGHQPMFSADSRYCIVFNGEIYNYKQLKKELISGGSHFLTNSDTEVILEGYAAWGIQVLQKLKGMFAFALYDTFKDEILLARDRFGIKPLFYAKQQNHFFFGSEIKAIRAFDNFQSTIRPDSVSSFLANRYVSDQYTMWQDIRKLPAGNFMILNCQNLQYNISSYWQLPHTQNTSSVKNVSEHFSELIRNSLSEHLTSDVQIGAFLSGGYDSSVLVSIMQNDLHYKTDAFSIGFKNWDQSEDQYAEIVAQHTGASLKKLSLDHIDLSILPKLMFHYDDPIADISILPTYAVSGLAAQNVKAVVSGEGADEFLGGYWWQKPENFMAGKPWQRWIQKITGLNNTSIKNHYIHAMSMGLFDTSELKKVLKNDFFKYIPEDPFHHFNFEAINGLSTLKKIQYLDIQHFMGELILTKVDRASMAHSLEVRVPFLDHELCEWLFSLPDEEYFKKGVQKFLLRNLLKDTVPAKILNRPKQGFVGPDKFYMNYKLYADTLLNGTLVQSDIIHKHYVEHLLSSKDHWRLWKLFVLEHWWNVWVQ
jgi:asparagine synthase (glutamine-hydrolysing)